MLPPLSLYVHLPWCERKCPYCDFNSHEAAAIPEDRYLDALIADLRVEAATERRPVQTVFLGGGTPSLFSVEAIHRLMQSIGEYVDLADDAEITMEANPGSTEAARLQGFAQAGITRFSLGVQSFSDRCLTALGRVHDATTAYRAITAAQASGVRGFNIDLMHGLPGQSLEEGLGDVAEGIRQAPAHLSWYQLTIEANTQFYSSPPLLPRESMLGELESQGAVKLEAAGYRRYEVSAWAQPGQECRHNLNYWRFGDYLAIGAGAHGKLSDNKGQILRYAKTRSPEDYMCSDGQSRRALRRLNDDDRVGEFMLNALRLREGFSLALFEQRTQLASLRVVDRLLALEDRGLLELAGSQYRCTELGWRFLDDVVESFFADKE